MSVAYHLTEYDADYEAMVRISREIRPDTFDSVDDHRDWDSNQRRAGRRSSRWFASVDGETVGFGALGESPWLHSALRQVDVQVHPDHQHQGVGRALLERVESLARDRGAASLLGSTEEHRDRSVRFLEAAGFEEIDRDLRSTLDLATFDPDQWSETVDRVASSGVRILPVTKLEDISPDWIDRLHELYVEVESDMPIKIPIDSMSRGDFEALILGRRMLPEAFFVAVDGIEFVGLTQPERVDGEDDVIAQDMTGVTRRARGRGIATAMKVAAATWAKDAGYRSIRTYNAESNAPMLAVNRKIGFVLDHASIEFRRDL